MRKLISQFCLLAYELGLKSKKNCLIGNYLCLFLAFKYRFSTSQMKLFNKKTFREKSGPQIFLPFCVNKQYEHQMDHDFKKL